MRILRLPASFSSPSVPLGCQYHYVTAFFASLVTVAVSTLTSPDSWGRVVRLIPLSCGDARISHVTMVPLLTLICFSTPADSQRLVFANVSTWPQILLNLRHQHSETLFEANSQTFISRCLRFVPSSLLTTQDSLPVAD
jgi:hypothetical protein